MKNINLYDEEIYLKILQRIKLGFLVLGFLLVAVIYFLIPFQTNFLLVGLDEGMNRDVPGHADAITLMFVSSSTRSVKMLSVPRELWLPIAGYNENQLSMSYLLGEQTQKGTGPVVLSSTVSDNFHVPIEYFVVIRMEDLVSIVDVLDGIDIILDKPISNYSAGVIHVNGQEALAFARNRTDVDDFTRMMQIQILIKGIIRKSLKADAWFKIPELLHVILTRVQSNIPFWMWPRLVYELSYAHLVDNIDGFAVTRDMVRPVITSQGVQVMMPRWELISNLIKDIITE